MTARPDRIPHIINEYSELLQRVDDWFARCSERYADKIACRRSCTGCCRGLFDISLLDARLLQEGFSRLAQPLREKVLAECRRRADELQAMWPDFEPPYILNHLPFDDWQQMPEDDMTPCPLLSEEGLCLVYAWRPMTCRLHGLPNIDITGESFSDEWCTLNFKSENPLETEGLRWNFRQTFAREFELLGDFTRQLTGTRRLELDTFIPTALLIDFNSPDWVRLPQGIGPAS